MFYGFLKDIESEFSYMVWGTGLIAASSFHVNGASPSEKQNLSLAGLQIRSITKEMMTLDTAKDKQQICW